MSPSTSNSAAAEAISVDAYPLSFPQQRPWFLNELVPGTAAYNLPVGCRLRGALDITALQSSISELIRRHEILRTVYCTQSGQPMQVVEPAADIDLPVWDVSDAADPYQAAKDHLDAEARRGFDLTKGPMIRTGVISIGSDDHLFYLGLHHIACDAWSVSIIARELSTLYAAQTTDTPSTLPEPELQYVDFAEWQHSVLDPETRSDLVAYWSERLAEAPVSIELPTDHIRPPNQEYAGDHVNLEIDAKVVRAADQLGATTASSPFSVFLSAFAVLLGRLSGQDDVVIGTPVANRNQTEMADMVGFFTNTLALRPDLTGEASFADLVRRVGAETRNGLAHQDLPFEMLVKELMPERNPSFSPVFQVMFILWEAGEDPIWTFPGLDVEPVNGDSKTSKFDLTLSLHRDGDRITARFEYATALFERATVERFADRYLDLLGSALATPDVPHASLALIGEDEMAEIVRFGDGGAAVVPKGPVFELIKEQASLRPTAPAMTDASGATDYATFNERTDCLCARLQAAGIKRGSVVGVYLDRSIDTVIAMVGIMKSGAAYLPLDPAFPKARLTYMVKDAKAALIVTNTDLASAASSLGTMILPLVADASPTPPRRAVKVRGSDLAYVIYTSGSTGKPKGVTITHTNLNAFLGAMDARIDAQDPGTWLAVTSISFDISVLELLWTLARGFHVVIRSDEIANPPAATSTASPIDLGFHFFGNAASAAVPCPEKYQMIMDVAQFADANGFSAIWTPERHFHAFGGLYPNPSVLSAAIAAVTKTISIRAGSVVLPLHDPLRVTEEWALVDNISKGRVGVSFASGWAPDDFVLAPDKYQDRKSEMMAAIKNVQHLWRGGKIARTNGVGAAADIGIFPRPVQPDFPIWITSASHPETFMMAGDLGAGILTHLVGQDIASVGEKIALYRKAFSDAGHAGTGHVAVMLHSYVHDDPDIARETVREPMKAYIKSSFDLMKCLGNAHNADMESLSEAEIDGLADHAFERFFDTSGLFGTPEMAGAQLARLQAIGVDEIGCLVDFGVDTADVMNGLDKLVEVRDMHRNASCTALDFTSIADLVSHFGVTHMQCTPTTAAVIVDDPKVRDALAQLNQLLVGGEPLSADLAGRLTDLVRGSVHNMYGPTEATVWSSCWDVVADAPVSIGTPLPGYRMRIMDGKEQEVPIGVVGELWIGGAAIAPGYLDRPDLSQDRFVQISGDKTPYYKTGDAAKWTFDGSISFQGRVDGQVKLRGRRIELGEIEECLCGAPSVLQAVVAIKGDGEARVLIGYIRQDKANPSDMTEVAAHLARNLPDHMIPVDIISVDSFPETPNGKTDRNALPDPRKSVRRDALIKMAPNTDLEQLIAGIWKELLGLDDIGVNETFFELGGNSILVVRVRSKLQEALCRSLPLVDLFRHVTIATLAAALAGDESPPQSQHAAIKDRETQAAKRRAARNRLGAKRAGEVVA